MNTAIRQTYQVSLRYLRALLRQPAFVVITIVQPLIWLLLFGALFKAVTQIPGFDGTSYICLLYTSPSPRDLSTSRMPSSA